MADWLWPHRILADSSWGEAWRGREAVTVLLASRFALAAFALAQVLHHFLVDLPMRLEPASRWATYRFGAACGALALLALTAVPAMRAPLLARAPLGVAVVVLTTLQALTVVWLPTVSYLYAYVLALAGAVLLRLSPLGTLAYLVACLASQWAFAWRYSGVPATHLVSGAMVTGLIALVVRGRMATDVRAFLSEQRELDTQRRLLQVQLEHNAKLTALQQQVIAKNRELDEANRLLEAGRVELLAQSRTDPLTELDNRRAFDEKLAYELLRASRYGSSLSCLMIDIDHFKQLNDRHGHAFGDRVLRAVAQVVRQSLRQTDIVARYGGEEFVALLPETDREAAVRVAERMRTSVEQLLVMPEDSSGGAGRAPVGCTISVGVATTPGAQAGSAKSLVRCADEQLYRAKSEGRNRTAA